MTLISFLNITFCSFLELDKKILESKIIWFSSISLLVYVLTNPKKAAYGKKLSKMKAIIEKLI